MKQENTNPQKKDKTSHALGEKASFLLLCLFYVVACTFIPLCFFIELGEWLTSVLCLSVCVFSVLALVRIAGSVQTLIGYILILAIFVIFGGAPLPAALFSAFIGSVCVFAYLLLKKASPVIWGLPAIPAVAALLFSESPVGLLLSLISLPCALALTWSVKKELSRIGAVCRISASICVMIVALFGFYVYSSSGELSFSAAKAIIDTAKEQLTVFLGSATEQLQDMLGADLASVDLNSVITVAISSVFNLLPAIIIVLCNISAYIIHSVFLSAYFASEEDKKKVMPMLVFDMSLTSAIVYIAALLLAFILVSDSVAIYGTAAENIVLILAPGLVLTALAGVRALTAKKGPSCLGTLLYMLLIFLIASLSPLVIMAVAFAGAIFVILAHIGKRKAHPDDN